MRALDLVGYWDADARPDGKYAAAQIHGYAVETHAGRLMCPDTPRYCRIPTSGPFRVAVQGDGRTREWDGSTWLIHRESCGAGGPVIYDAAGRLRIADCAEVGSQGYRYVSPTGELVTGDASRVRRGSELLELTDLGDGLIVGQGPHGGLWGQLPDGYREIVPGETFVVRAHRVGDQVAVACYTPVPRGSATAHLRWFTLDELRALPARPTTKPAWRDEPPCEVPHFAVPDHPIAVQIFGGPGFRMNLGAGHDRDPHATPSGAFVTIDHDDEAAFQRQAAYARQHNVPLFQYIDKGTPWRSDRLRRVDGVRCVAAVRCYSGRVDEASANWDRASADIRTLRDAGVETALVLAGYRQMIGYGPEMNWRLPPVLTLDHFAWSLGARTPTVRHALIFHQRRHATHPETGQVHVDGLDSRPELQLMADRIIAAAAAYVPKPVEPPKPIEPAPVPEPPSDPEIPEDSPVPDHSPDAGQMVPDPPMIATRPDKPIGGSLWRDLWRWVTKTNWRKTDFRFWR